MVTWVEESVRAEEERVIRDTLDQFTRPAAIKNIEISFGEDHSGHPAVWVWMIVPRTMPLKGPRWDAAYEYCEEVSSALVAKRLSHWPYVSLRMQRPVSA